MNLSYDTTQQSIFELFYFNSSNLLGHIYYYLFYFGNIIGISKLIPTGLVFMLIEKPSKFIFLICLAFYIADHICNSNKLNTKYKKITVANTESNEPKDDIKFHPWKASG